MLWFCVLLGDAIFIYLIFDITCLVNKTGHKALPWGMRKQLICVELDFFSDFEVHL